MYEIYPGPACENFRELTPPSCKLHNSQVKRKQDLLSTGENFHYQINLQKGGIRTSLRIRNQRPGKPFLTFFFFH